MLKKNKKQKKTITVTIKLNHVIKDIYWSGDPMNLMLNCLIFTFLDLRPEKCECRLYYTK